MKQSSFFLPLLCLIFFACTPSQDSSNEQWTTTRIAFGSCSDQDKPQPMLDVAAALKPDAFLYLGDNIYGDTENMDTLQAKYNRLGAKASFQHLKANTQLYAVWDDHDYGENDAGRHYPFKEASKEIFLNFWEVPDHSDRRKHPGIYGVEYLEKEGLKIQLLFLDTRTFRDDLVHRMPADSIQHKNDYVPNQVADSTFLGSAQWAWLAQQFKVPADLRIIASSNQFSHAYNGWESWTNVPHEQQRMLDLIQTTKANGVIFISGDVHWGEISKLKTKQTYPIYDITSSGITQTWDIIEPNKHRVGKAVPQNNIGLIEIKSNGDKLNIEAALLDTSAQRVVQHSIAIQEISF